MVHSLLLLAICVSAYVYFVCDVVVGFLLYFAIILLRQRALVVSFIENIENQASMIPKYHNHKLQTNPGHCKGELHDIYSTRHPKRQ